MADSTNQESKQEPLGNKEEPAPKVLPEHQLSTRVKKPWPPSPPTGSIAFQIANFAERFDAALTAGEHKAAAQYLADMRSILHTSSASAELGNSYDEYVAFMQQMASRLRD
jgi:hypothetical protein